MEFRLLIQIIVLCIFTILYVIPSVILSITSYVIAINNWNITCDENALVSLHVWLIVTASVCLASIFLYLSINGIYFFLAIYRNEFLAELTVFLVAPLYCVMILSSLFLLIWNIIGSVSLFRDSTECRNSSKDIFINVCIVLVFQWISTIYYCCFAGSIPIKNSSLKKNYNYF